TTSSPSKLHSGNACGVPCEFLLRRNSGLPGGAAGTHFVSSLGVRELFDFLGGTPEPGADDRSHCHMTTSSDYS
ncbi:MAG: hypothetical protein QNL12_13160, partial [Acidimicrobiia bacterium]|nr:hypothetical protein [Acidimicrobiia bacterium]MDX2468261.1 hypothetical protein [Acidimicrobiia bacterium]